MSLLELLNLETGVPVETLRRIISSAPKRYKVYPIKKRSGGERMIAQPSRELKLIQRVVLTNILNKMPVSPIATAYVQGRGIVDNARLHLGQRWILKLDFTDFFPSLKPKDWDRRVRNLPNHKEIFQDRILFHNILFWGDGGRLPRCLSIGAPTSPTVSNILCWGLDNWLIDAAGELGILVSRYADDITLSSNNRHSLERFERLFARYLASTSSPILRLNEAKRGLYGPGEKRMVTGLILTPTGAISVGRQRKREVSALVHKFGLGLLDPHQSSMLRGWVGFIKFVEPEFWSSLENKYGVEALRAIAKFEMPHLDGYDWAE